MAKQERGNAYLLMRLENEFPAIFANWKAGKYESPRQALVAAGLKSPQRQINILKNAWGKASAMEQAEFRRWIGASGSSAASAGASPHVTTGTMTATKPTSPGTPRSTPPGISKKTVNAAGHLQPWAQARIRQIMDTRNIKMGGILTEIGFSQFNPSLGNAMRSHRPTQIAHDMAIALERWLKDNRAIL